MAVPSLAYLLSVQKLLEVYIKESRVDLTKPKCSIKIPDLPARMACSQELLNLSDSKQDFTDYDFCMSTLELEEDIADSIVHAQIEANNLLVVLNDFKSYNFSVPDDPDLYNKLVAAQMIRLGCTLKEYLGRYIVIRDICTRVFETDIRNCSCGEPLCKHRILATVYINNSKLLQPIVSDAMPGYF